MAIHPEPHEDLLGEATAMPERGKLVLEGEPHPVLIGLRPDGAASIYWGDDPVLHFDAQGRLRRVFINGGQLVARQGQLLRHARSGPGGRVTSAVEPLSPEQQTQLLAAVMVRLQRVLQAVGDGSARWTGSTVPVGQLTRRLAPLVAATEGGIRIAQRPNAR